MGVNERTLSRARIRRWLAKSAESLICAVIFLGSFYAAAFLAFLFQVIVGVA